MFSSRDQEVRLNHYILLRKSSQKTARNFL